MLSDFFPKVWALICAHDLLFALVLGLIASKLIHYAQPHAPRLVGFIQAILPGDSPKAWDALVDKLPPTDRAIAQALETVLISAPIEKTPVTAPKIPPLLVLFLICVIANGGLAMVSLMAACSASPLVTTSLVDEGIDAGCELIGILDLNGQTAATICKVLEPIVAPFVVSAVNDLGEKKGDEIPLKFVSLKRSGKAIGVVRADIAVSVQAKVDAL